MADQMPWEMYAPKKAIEPGVKIIQQDKAPISSPTPSANPWELYSEKQVAAPGIEVIQEQHPDIGFWKRMNLKNLGGSNEDIVNILKSEGFDAYVTGEDQIAVKRPKETQYKVLDPATGEGGILEPLQDIGDVGYDVLSGAAQTAATGAAGLAGAAGSPYALGLGAIPAAMVAGSGTGATAELLRQYLGGLTGARTEPINKNEIALSGAVGAAAPLLFGSGASKAAISKALQTPQTAGKVLEKTLSGAIKEGEKPTGEQLLIAARELKQSQAGVLSEMGKKFLSVFSGSAPEETLKNATKDATGNIVKDLAANGLEINPARKYTNQELAIAMRKQDVISGFGAAAANTVADALENQRQEYSKLYNQGLAKTGVTFDISKFKGPLEDVVEYAKTRKTEAAQQKGEAAKNLLGRFFSAAETPAPTQVMDDLGNLVSYQPERRTFRVGKELRVSAQEAQDLLNSMSDWIDYSKSPIALDKTNPAERQLRGLMIDAKDRLSDEFYDAIENSSDVDLRKAYAKNRDFFRKLYPKFKDPETAAKTLANIDSPSSQITRERVSEFDKAMGTDLLGLGKLASVAKVFGDPSLEAVSSGGATSTGKILRAGEILGSAGYMAGSATGVAGAPRALAQAGRAIGMVGTSPKIVSKYLETKTAARRLGEKVGAQDLLNMLSAGKQKLPITLQNALAPQSAAPMTWNLMRENK